MTNKRKHSFTTSVTKSLVNKVKKNKFHLVLRFTIWAKAAVKKSNKSCQVCDVYRDGAKREKKVQITSASAALQPMIT